VDGGLGEGKVKIVVIKCGVREAMTERKKSGPTNFIMEAVVDVDIFAVEDTTTLRAVVEEGLIILNAVWKGDRQFAALWEIS